MPVTVNMLVVVGLVVVLAGLAAALAFVVACLRAVRLDDLDDLGGPRQELERDPPVLVIVRHEWGLEPRWAVLQAPWDRAEALCKSVGLETAVLGRFGPAELIELIRAAPAQGLGVWLPPDPPYE